MEEPYCLVFKVGIPRKKNNLFLKIKKISIAWKTLCKLFFAFPIIRMCIKRFKSKN